MKSEYQPLDPDPSPAMPAAAWEKSRKGQERFQASTEIPEDADLRVVVWDMNVPGLVHEYKWDARPGLQDLGGRLTIDYRTGSWIFTTFRGLVREYDVGTGIRGMPDDCEGADPFWGVAMVYNFGDLTHRTRVEKFKMEAASSFGGRLSTLKPRNLCPGQPGQEWPKRKPNPGRWPKRQ